ncbi:hypothetical protein DKX38_018108 [Salix brachista]|uniref:Uncharacterized protein n=1 Tax=Salix brachista TaxID=2182728 RepID=A0A5N5KXF7_9ROSI|nr:hypothetical protein DKX38_018108 [Salix brachista]
MASPKSVNILDICMVGAAHDSKSGTDTTLEFSPTFFELEYFRLPPSACVPLLLQTYRLKPKLLPLRNYPQTETITLTCTPSLPPYLAESDDDFDRLAGNGIREAADSHPHSPQLVAAETKANILSKKEKPRFYFQKISPQLDSAGLESNPRSVKPLSKLDVQPNLLRATFQLTTEDITKLRESVLNYHHPAETDPTERLNLSTYVLACS